MYRYFRSGLYLSGLLLTLSSPLGSAQADSEAQTYEQQLQELTAYIEEIKQDLNTAKDEKGKLEQSLQLSEEEISELSQKIKEITEAIERQKKQLSQLRRQESELEQQQQHQQQHIGKHVRQTLMLGDQSPVKLFLNQEDPSKLSRLVIYHRYIATARQQQINQYRQAQLEIQTVKNSILATTQNLKSDQLALAEEQKALQDSRSKRHQTLAKLNQTVNDKGQQLERSLENQQRLQTLLDEITRLASQQLSGNSFKNAKGDLPLPTSGKVTVRYGSKRYQGGLPQRGITIRAKPGTKVISVHQGRVIFSDYLRGHGLLLIIDHGGGYMSLYGHNQTLLKQTGDWANAGEVIATAGNSGGQETAGVYFEVRHQGQPQNPEHWLRS